MAARLSPFASAARSFSRQSPTSIIRNVRSFSSSTRLLQIQTAALPVRKPVGAFRGTIFGFLLGSTLSGSALYYYVIKEYQLSNELLTEDIYNLQSAVQRMEGYVKNIEVMVVESKRK